MALAGELTDVELAGLAGVELGVAVEVAEAGVAVPRQATKSTTSALRHIQDGKRRKSESASSGSRSSLRPRT